MGKVFNINLKDLDSSFSLNIFSGEKTHRSLQKIFFCGEMKIIEFFVDRRHNCARAFKIFLAKEESTSKKSQFLGGIHFSLELTLSQQQRSWSDRDEMFPLDSSIGGSERFQCSKVKSVIRVFHKRTQQLTTKNRYKDIV